MADAAVDEEVYGLYQVTFYSVLMTLYAREDENQPRIETYQLSIEPLKKPNDEPSWLTIDRRRAVGESFESVVRVDCRGVVDIMPGENGSLFPILMGLLAASCLWAPVRFYAQMHDPFTGKPFTVYAHRNHLHGLQVPTPPIPEEDRRRWRR